MSHERTSHGYTFACDTPGCGNTIEPTPLARGSAPRDFQDSFADAKEAGWRAVKVVAQSGRGPQWEHRCPACARP